MYQRPTAPAAPRLDPEPEERYAEYIHYRARKGFLLLQLVAWIHYIIGIMILLSSCAWTLGLASVSVSSPAGALAAAVGVAGTIFVGFFGGIAFLAAGQFIMLLVNIEAHSRANADMMLQLLSRRRR